MDKILCKCDNKECGLELNLLPYGLGSCPHCGRGRLRPTQPVHPLAYAPTKSHKMFSETHVKKLVEECIAEIEEWLRIEAEMDKYESSEG